MRSLLRVLLVFVLPGSEVRAESQGIIVRQATVYADAGIAGGSVGNVPAGVTVNMFKRKGDGRKSTPKNVQSKLDSYAPGVDNAGRVGKVVAVP